jgi:hypothetical protein
VKTNAAQTSISANKLLIARSPENEIESKLIAPCGARLQYGATSAQRLVARRSATRSLVMRISQDGRQSWQLTAAVVPTDGCVRQTGAKFANQRRKNSALGKLTRPVAVQSPSQYPVA